ncbi:argininosuccinate synthase [Candidatus Bathyarchaeota archaeon]|jgi:argininosuccinate synthase|nr:argininosuccinate synthase [Candidatus Bathyarchaeota archaeon]
MKEKVVLAYSGGLDTSVAIRWIQEKYNADVVTVTVDVGQQEDLAKIESNSKVVGAIRHYSIDAKEEFVENYVHPAVKANALYEGKYPLSTALARPLIVNKLVEVARKEKATAVAHGSTGKGNDQVRFDVSIKVSAPELKIIAPIREWNLSRDEEIKYAEKNGIPIPVSLNRPYSVDQNLWGRSIEAGILEDPAQQPPEEIYEWTVAPEKAPTEPEYVSIGFENGVPVTVNGAKMSPLKIVQTLNAKAGSHGIGRIDHMEDRLVGIKSRECYECPAATVVLDAHKELEKTVLTRHELQFKQQVEAQWTFLVYAGLWMEPLREDLDEFIDKTQERVTGEVKLKLYKGSATVVSRSSPLSLYDANLATYNIETTFDQKWSEGFIEIWALPTKAASILKSKGVK